jgi:hypothetical protein
VVRDEEHALLLCHLAIDMEPDAEDLANLAVVPMREGAGIARAGRKKQELERHQRDGEGEEGREHQERTHASHESEL